MAHIDEPPRWKPTDIIRAAPDLYDALERLMIILDAGDGDHSSLKPSVAAIRKFAKLINACDAARAALAKARGEQ